MKRLSSLILCAAIMLCFPAAVYADLVAPIRHDTLCVVTNPDGAVFYYIGATNEGEPETKVLPYGTEILMTHRYTLAPLYKDEDGEIHYITDVGGVQFNGEAGYVSLSDISEITDEDGTTEETTDNTKETTTAKPSTTAKPIETKTVTETTSDVTATDTAVTEPTSYFEETSPAVQTAAETVSEKAEVKDSIKSSSKMTAVCVAAAAAVALTAGVTIALIRKKKNSDGSNENGR